MVPSSHADGAAPRSSYSPISASAVSDDAAAPLNEDAQPRASGNRRHRLVMAGRVGVFAGLLVAGSCAMWLSGRSRGHLRSIAQERMEIKATWDSDFPTQCQSMEVDVEYVDESGGWGINYDHIPTPEMCCAQCQQDKRCKAFTWVKDAGLEGQPSQCWLKGHKGTARPRVGLVSGVPPAAPALADIPTGVAGPAGSLFCYSLMVTTSDEPKLLAWQYRHAASIFACDEAAIYSNKEMELVPGSGVISKVVDSDLKCKFGGDSMSALNAWIFIAVWDKMLKDGDYKKHDWVVKVDPDAVFFPDRLGKVLVHHKGEGYISNCKYGLHGPIEVFSSASMETLAADYKRSWDGKAPHRCVTGQHFGSWGEDMFIDQCLGKVLGESSTLDSRLMCESHCNCPSWYWCTNGTDRVSFHPFKTVDAYEVCMANAMGLSTETVYDDAHYHASYLEHDSDFEEVPSHSHGHDTFEGKEVSCKDQCGSKYDPSAPCQCNDECSGFNSCCHDYEHECQGEPSAEVGDSPAAASQKTRSDAPHGNENGDGECEDATDGGECDSDDACCVATRWAKEHGIYEHPKWYHDLPASAPYQDFQMDLHKQGKSDCKMPCKKVSGIKASDLKAVSDAGKDLPPGPIAHTFYMYRAQSKASYPLGNINTADLAGVMWYLHNEVIVATPRKYSIDRIKRYRVTVKNTWEFWNAHKRQFGAFVAYDGARCSTPVCKDIYHQYGFIVGCQVCDTKVASYLSKSQTNWNCEAGEDQCNAPLWYSLPGPCPSMGLANEDIGATGTHLDVASAKTPDCIERMPGGHCDKANGAPDCTYSYEDAGEIMLDDLVGIDDYNEFWNMSYTRCAQEVAEGTAEEGTECIHKKEYVPFLDKGVGTDFWNGIHDAEKCTARMEAVRKLFKTKNPDFPESLPEPACEFDMYYDGEFDWPINHTHATPSSWWDHRMSA